MPNKPPYRATNGRFYSGSLFLDVWKGMSDGYRRHNPVFTLFDDGEFEGEPLINCRTTFIEEADPTGYKWAMKYLASWQHWQRLITFSWFQEALAQWQEELAIKLHSEAIEEIVNLSRSSTSDAQRLGAAKYLAERGWEKKAPRGRPKTSEGPSRNTGIANLDEDAERIGLKVIKGGK